MIHKLRKLQSQGKYIRVGVIGLGAMGRGVAWQTCHTVAMEVAFIADLSQAAADSVVAAMGKKSISLTAGMDFANLPPRKAGEEVYTVVGDTEFILQAIQAIEIDALAECTSSVYEAFLYSKAAIERKAHVILMNAEVDLFLGTTLARMAAENGVVVTSDAGDQHGVLATMIDEVELWGFKIVQAGNMKGFLKRDADSEHARPWAEKQKGSVQMTVAYSDGTKMNIENAIIGNYAGLIPLKPGGEGPSIKTLEEIFQDGVFSWDQYGEQGRVDYTLGVPFPGGGVYVVGYCDDDQQDFLMNYYKVINKRPYYLFFRPYHLCHVETPRAIAQAVLDHRAVICPPLGKKLNDVYTYAKKDLKAGDVIGHAIGGDEIYGMIDATANGEPNGQVPIYYLEAIRGGGHATVLRDVAKDEVLRWEDVSIPDSTYLQLLKAQNGF